MQRFDLRGRRGLGERVPEDVVPKNGMASASRGHGPPVLGHPAGDRPRTKVKVPPTERTNTLRRTHEGQLRGRVQPERRAREAMQTLRHARTRRLEERVRENVVLNALIRGTP